MVNKNKRAGDEFERKAVAFLTGLTPSELCVPNPQRLLGAGRKEDVGDLQQFYDVAVQVRRYANLSTAIRSSAMDAAAQARNSGMPYSFGMAPILNAPKTSVNWVITQLAWPRPIDEDEVAVFGDPNRAVAHIRNDSIGVPRRRRIARIDRDGKESIWVSPFEAWLDWYVTAPRNPRWWGHLFEQAS